MIGHARKVPNWERKTMSINFIDYGYLGRQQAKTVVVKTAPGRVFLRLERRIPHVPGASWSAFAELDLPDARRVLGDLLAAIRVAESLDMPEPSSRIPLPTAPSP